MSTEQVQCEKCNEFMTSYDFASHMCGEELELLKEMEETLYEKFQGNKRRMKRSFKRKGVSKYDALIDKL